MYPLKINRDIHERVYLALYRTEHAEKSLCAIVDRAAWRKVTKGRAGIGRDSVVEEIWKGVRGKQEEIVSVEKNGGYQKESKKKG